MNGASRPLRFPRRVTVGIALAALSCLWGSLQSYEVETAYQQQYADAYSVSVQVDRLAPLLAVVPESAILGYLTDVEPGSDIDSVMINTAGYALAPRLIERAGSHEWVLGNFIHPGNFAEMGRSKGLRLQQDFGNGVVLFRSGN